MGGDHGPGVTIPALALAARRLGPDVRFLAHGEAAQIDAELAKLPDLAGRVEVRHTDKQVASDEKPATALRRGKGSSMWNAVEAVKLGEAGGAVSIFVDPDPRQLDAAAALGAPFVELHTGAYAYADGAVREAELARLVDASRHARSVGLRVNAGHGLHYQNVARIAAIEEFGELNIGHAIVARALFSGFAEAVREMKRLLVEARR